jgi:Flp pilus assembly protein TadB
VEPSYFAPMIKETLGWVMLGAGVLSILVGMAIIQKIVRIQV